MLKIVAPGIADQISSSKHRLRARLGQWLNSCTPHWTCSNAAGSRHGRITQGAVPFVQSRQGHMGVKLRNSVTGRGKFMCARPTNSAAPVWTLFRLALIAQPPDSPLGLMISKQPGREQARLVPRPLLPGMRASAIWEKMVVQSQICRRGDISSGAHIHGQQRKCRHHHQDI